MYEKMLIIWVIIQRIAVKSQSQIKSTTHKEAQHPNVHYDDENTANLSWIARC